MALGTGRDVGRFLSPNKPRVGHVLIRNDVTFGALERRMVRNDFDVGDITMTGAAISRRMRQDRVVSLVARHAGPARIVTFRHNLRETGWP